MHRNAYDVRLKRRSKAETSECLKAGIGCNHDLRSFGRDVDCYDRQLGRVTWVGDELGEF